MGKYEDLLIKYDDLSIKEKDDMPSFLSGLYLDGEIHINNSKCNKNKLETLAEELAHHKITYGNIINPNCIMNRKYELKARRLANEMLISLNDIVEAFKNGVHNLYELAEYFEVTQEFVLKTIEHYKQKHGLNTKCGDYVIKFEPLRVFEYKEI